ncbi:MAG: FHA domain-containing protein, partial [Acidimicrobiales bacterium]
MQIVYRDGDHRRELDVRVNSPSATVADLAAALDPAGADRVLLIGDHAADLDFELIEAGLHEGAEVRFAGPSVAGRGPLAAPPWPDPARQQVHRPLELAVVNGLDAGRRFPLVAGTMVVGRAPGCEIVLHDGTLSRRHAALTLSPAGEVIVDDLGSHNGTWVDGEPVVAPVPLGEGAALRLGALELEVRPAVDHDRPLAFDPLRHTNAAGTIPFNRPPRPAPPPAPADVAAPTPPNAGQGKVGLSIIGILAPLAFAGLMFAVLKQAQFLLFAGLSPVMAIANAIDGKRKGRRSERSERERFARELVEFRDTLTGLADDERRRREAASPDPAEVLRRVVLPSTTLWERRPAHRDFLLLRAGVGAVRWRPPVTEPPRSAATPDE